MKLKVSHGLLIIFVHGVPGEDVEIHALYHSILHAEWDAPGCPLSSEDSVTYLGEIWGECFLSKSKDFFLWSARLQSQLQALHTEGEPPIADSLQNAADTCWLPQKNQTEETEPQLT